MKGLFGGAALAALVLAVSALSANDASYTVERFEWTPKEGCVAVGNNGTQREVIGGVTERECASVTKLTNVQVDLPPSAKISSLRKYPGSYSADQTAERRSSPIGCTGHLVLWQVDLLRSHQSS